MDYVEHPMRWRRWIVAFAVLWATVLTVWLGAKWFVGTVNGQWLVAATLVPVVVVSGFGAKYSKRAWKEKQAASMYFERGYDWPTLALRLLYVVAAVGVGLSIVSATPPGSSNSKRSYHNSISWGNRDQYGRLVADFTAGRLGRETALPWPVREIAFDGVAHRRCSPVGDGDTECVLFLLTDRDFAGTWGAGYAYYPKSPDQYADPTVRTIGDHRARPVRQLRNGWWWVA
ncbi:hypothetical protein [Longispora urticae]